LIDSITRSKHPLDDLRHGLGVSPVDASAEYPQLPQSRENKPTTGGAILLKAAEKIRHQLLGRRSVGKHPRPVAVGPRSEGTQTGDRSMLDGMVAARSRLAAELASSHGWSAAPRIGSSGGSKMASQDQIRNPVEWGWDRITLAALNVEALGRSLRGSEESRFAPLPAVCRIKTADLRDVLVRGLGDFGAYRTDVIFLCLIYPVVGIVLGWLTFGQEMLPLLFPLASGFALVGPVAAVGLYEMSRRREQGIPITWVDAFGAISSPAFGAILVLGLVLLAIFLLWLLAANAIYAVTLGPAPPVSIAAFARDVFTTSAGWAMIVVGVGVGFIFALLVLAISVVSFPMLLDRDVGLHTAVRTSIRSVAANPGPMTVWGLIVAGALVIGSIPAFLGLIFVMPVLGHATWHLYRKVVP